MNIQEGIKELESHKMKSEDIRAIRYNDGINAGIAVMKKLDEPQKPVVPKCAEPFLKEAKCSTDVIQLFVDILHATDSDGFIWENWKWTADFYEWLAKDSDTLYILCDALRYGYEVEKEPLYYVYFPEIIASPEIFFPDIEGAYLMKSDDGIELADNNDFEDMKFTEREIKAIDERYWAFAVPVEEVAE